MYIKASRGHDRMVVAISANITTKVVCSNPADGDVYSIPHCVIKFVIDFRQVGVFSGYFFNVVGVLLLFIICNGIRYIRFGVMLLFIICNGIRYIRFGVLLLFIICNGIRYIRLGVMVFNAIFNNISVLLLEETGENHRKSLTIT